MRGRNLDAPWNSQRPVEVTPEEYKWQVFDWLRASEGDPASLKIGRLEKIAGAGGEYEFDVVTRFSRFGEAEFVVLAEYKRYRSPIKRDQVLTLHHKLIDAGVHKDMVFSTGDFQRGAIEYATQFGIALLNFKDGRATYETRNDGPSVEPPP